MSEDLLVIATVALAFFTFILGICALLAPIIDGLKDRTLFAPNLKIFFKLDSPYCHKTNAGSIPAYYFRFRIVNCYKNGRFHYASQARNCEAVLENIWKYDSSGEPVQIKNFTPVNLNMGPQFAGIKKFIDLNPSRGVFCDIGHICQSDSRFSLDMLEHYNVQRQYEYLDPGDEYILQYVVYSGNAKDRTQCFHISWSGKWKENPEDMFRELVIKLADKPKNSIMSECV